MFISALALLVHVFVAFAQNETSNVSGQSDLQEGLTCPLKTLGATADNSLGYEAPPASFSVSPYFKSGGRTFRRDPTLIAMVHCVGAMAQRPWDDVLNETFRCRQKPELSLDVRPAIAGPTMLTKHAIWSLQAVLDWWVGPQRMDLRDTNFLTKLDDTPLGFGTISSSGLFGGSAEEQRAGNVSDVVKRQEDGIPVNETALGAGYIGLKIAFRYPAGAITNSIGFYTLLFDAIIKLAEYPADQGVACERLYERVLNVTIEFGATSVAAAAAGTFTASMAITALLELADFMNEQPIGDKFSTFTSTIRRDRRIIGRLNFYKGRIYRPTDNAAEPALEVETRPTVARRTEKRD